eukprot:TRINITY_DN11339_c0_g1_i1.p2 TRINITY_DN11339_c0_g1~~TRINITY_DN11339_c0_g1_i1.p2  ORF type:complete len:86 (-),score=15.91 TRINITY_DN11339_c0_g1_i1:513-770(-)
MRHIFADRVITLEPDPIAFAGLLQNVAVNPKFSRNITMYNECLANETGIYMIGSSGSSGSRMRPSREVEIQDTPLVTCTSPRELL